jgi:hypothetical protein
VARTGILAQEQVQVGEGAQLVHAALQARLSQFGRPGRDPLVRGQHLVRRKFAAHQGGIARVLGPPLHPGLLGGRLPALLRLLGSDFHDGAGDGGA